MDLLSIFNANPMKIPSKLLKPITALLQEVESRILRLADFGVARKLLFVRYLSCRLSGSNSVGRMPASRLTLSFL